MEETWEYHARYEIAVYYDGRIHDLDRTDLRLFLLLAIQKNSSHLHLLNPESDQRADQELSPALRDQPVRTGSGIKYSTLVKQYSLSREAFEFWNILEEQSKQSGELYESQPSADTWQHPPAG